MKTFRFNSSPWIVLAFIVVLGCVPDYDIVKERPDDIIDTKPCKTLYRSIIAMFPEYKNNRDTHKALFSDTVLKQIVLTKETDVYLTFIAEGAGYSNSFGYYTYNKNASIQNESEIEKNLIFPNVSDRILNQGDMLKLEGGPFPAGTVIGFFLVFQGWDQGSVNFDKPIAYTNYNLNAGGHQQHIFFKQKDCGDYVLAFEDQPLEDNADFDFNDMIFTVADNQDEHETSSFELKDLPQL
jgi:Domain of unknown function (DUF4114)